MSKFKYYTLTGDALKVLPEYKAALLGVHAAQEALIKEYEAKMQALHEADLKRRRKLWVTMASSVGLDAEATWGSYEYGVEVRFLASGFGAITFQQMPPQLGGGMPSPEEPAVARPKDTVLN